jgi:3-oxoacyl-[acyl-carrier-protein] synthase-3
MNASILDAKLSLIAAANCYPDQHLDNDALYTALSLFCGSRYARKAKFIARNLGVHSRFFSRSISCKETSPIITNAELSAALIEDLLQSSALSIEQLDYLIAHTTTPDTLLPPGISWVAEKLNYTGPFIELRQACTGFANALQFALPRILMTNRPLVILGSETGSLHFNFDEIKRDNSQLINFMQMGDGAAGVLLAPWNGSDRGVISGCYFGQIGTKSQPGLTLPSRDIGDDLSPYLFRHDAVSVKQNGAKLIAACVSALNAQGYDIQEFNYIIPHQASGLIDQQVAQLLAVPISRVVNDAKWLGNLGSAAIWSSFSHLINSGKLKQGETVAILGAEATKYMYGGFVYTH